MNNALGARLRAHGIAQLLCLVSVSLLLFASSCGSCGPSGIQTGGQAPAVPGGVKVTLNADHSPHVAWDAVTGATSYDVYWVDTLTGTPVLLGNTKNTFYNPTGSFVGAGHWDLVNGFGLFKLGFSG